MQSPGWPARGVSVRTRRVTVSATQELNSSLGHAHDRSCEGFRMPASDSGATYTSGRRPKAAKERTRGGWGAENAAHSAMGIWLLRKVCARERGVLRGGWLRGWQAAIARVDD